MDRLEKFFYELRPFNLLFVAAFAMYGEKISRWGQASVALLAISSVLILFSRYQYRSSVQLRRH